MNFAKNANEVQLWSVIPYAVAAILTGNYPLLCIKNLQTLILYFHSVFVAFLSDRLKLRGVVMLFSLPIAIIGYAVIANTDNPKVQYGMTFMMATGMYASVPCILVWMSNNSAGHYKRATTSAMQLAIANCGGFVASKYYFSQRFGDFFSNGFF